MDKDRFTELGSKIYEWRKSGKLKLLYGTDGRDLEVEVERISALIEYVRNKMSSLANKVD